MNVSFSVLRCTPRACSQSWRRRSGEQPLALQ